VSAVTDWKNSPDLPQKLSEYHFTTDLAGVIRLLKDLGDKVRWPRKSEKTGKKDSNKWCDFHDDYGHLTPDCVSLRREIKILHDKGYLKSILPTVNATEEDLPEPPPMTYKRINVISGGSEICGLTHSAARKYARGAGNAEGLEVLPIRATAKDLPTISFGEEDAPGGQDPHHDALVISLSLANCEVGRILVDNGSSANLIMLSTLQDMGYRECDILKKSIPLVGFSGETKHTIGEISLPTYAAGINLPVRYLVIDCPSSYNVILGRPWIHSMKAIPSTYHQCIKIPTPWGVQEIRGDQHSARGCYQKALKAEAPKSAA
jgi:hypothetical protein